MAFSSSSLNAYTQESITIISKRGQLERTFTKKQVDFKAAYIVGGYIRPNVGPSLKAGRTAKGTARAARKYP